MGNNVSILRNQLQFILDHFDMGLCTKREAWKAMISAAQESVFEIEAKLMELEQRNKKKNYSICDCGNNIALT